MNLATQGFWTPKAGSSEAEYEDAIAIGPAAVAIADGATESSFASAWAHALSTGFACDPFSERPDLSELIDRVGPLQAAWHASIAWDRLPWFAEDKARNGAFAALLTLRFDGPLAKGEDPEGPPERKWNALAIGDTCLFQIRDDSLYLAFPLTESVAFDSTPCLLSSNPARNLQVWDQAQALNGQFKPADILLLMTDALAKWFLAETEAGRKPWHTLCSLPGQEDFAQLIAALREERALKNDDTSLIVIRESNAAPEACSPAAHESESNAAPEIDGRADHEADAPDDSLANRAEEAPAPFREIEPMAPTPEFDGAAHGGAPGVRAPGEEAV